MPSKSSLSHCNQLCPYNTIDGCNVAEKNGTCPLTQEKKTEVSGRSSESYEAEIVELKADISSLEFENSAYKQELGEKEKHIEFMRGQIEAFKFCVSCGNAKKKGE